MLVDKKDLNDVVALGVEVRLNWFFYNFEIKTLFQRENTEGVF